MPVTRLELSSRLALYMARYFLCFAPHDAHLVFAVAAGCLRQFVQIPCVLASRRLIIWAWVFWLSGLGLLYLRSAGLSRASMVLLALISASFLTRFDAAFFSARLFLYSFCLLAHSSHLVFPGVAGSW